jgi:hypothetical protein
MDSMPTQLMVPCFAGAPRKLDQLDQLQGWTMRTMRLPQRLDDLEELADFVLAQVRIIDRYVLVGDSFGAVISIAALGSRGRSSGLYSAVVEDRRADPDPDSGDDRLIGKGAAGILLSGIRRSREVVLPRTGHMFRLSHPSLYSEAVYTFLQSTIPAIGGEQ